MRDRKNAWQPPLSSITQLPAPTAWDVYGIADIARQCLYMHAGKVAEAAKSLHVAPGADTQGDGLHSIDLPSQDAGPDIPCVVLGFLSDEKVDEDVIVLEAGLDWEPASEHELEAADEDIAVISLMFNRRWSAAELMKNGVHAFYELIEMIAHEIAHAFDRENTASDPEYLNEVGEKQQHKYGFNECEVRARVWAALVVYTHAYLVSSMTDVWEDLITAPKADAADSDWDTFLSECVVGEEPLDEFNVDTRREMVELIKRTAVAVRDQAQLLVDAGELEQPSAFSVKAQAIGLGLKPVDGEQACAGLAEHAAQMWENRGQ